MLRVQLPWSGGPWAPRRWSIYTMESADTTYQGFLLQGAGL